MDTRNKLETLQNSPRSQDRGPIEAPVPSSARATSALPLRGPKTAAPLKRRFRKRELAPLRVSPRSQDRGPIEARRGRCGFDKPRLSLRGPKTAAPLKLFRRGGRAGPAAALRGPKTAAPFKQSAPHAAGAQSILSPRSQDRGPIEAL